MLAIIPLILFIFSVSIVGFSLYTGISPMPSSTSVKKIVQAQMHSPKRIYELGSGWGGVIFSLSKAFPNAEIIAYEISFFPWFFSKIVHGLKRTPNVKILNRNFFMQSLERAEVIYCYLSPKIMTKLKLKLDAELKSDCIVISNTFSMPGWKAQKIIEIKDLWGSKIFIYKIEASRFDFVNRKLF